MPVSFVPKFVDLVRTASTTTGTGPLVPGLASTGFQSFAESLAVGDRFYYCAQGVEKPTEREVGRGTLQANGTIARDPVSGALTNFTLGNKTIALVTAAEWFRKLEAQGVNNGGTVVSGVATVATRADLTSRPAVAAAQVELTEGGRAGSFVFDPTPNTSRISADPAQGLHVAPTSDSSGASGAWVRQFTGAIDVRWFGAKADFLSDDLAAFNAAQALIKSGFAKSRTLRAEGRFFLSGTFHITSIMTIEGAGPGFDGDARSVIRFGKNVDGITVHHAQSSPLVGLTGDASGSRIAHLQLWGGGITVNGAGVVTNFAAGDSTTGHGVRIRGAFVTCEDVQTSFFGGDGFSIVATSGAGGEVGGNANNFRLDNCQSIYNRGAGYTIAGTDANAGSTYTCSAISNGGGGIVDYSFLGNGHHDAHIRDCGITDPTGSNGPTGTCAYAGQFWYVVNGRQVLASTQAPGAVSDGTEAWRVYGGYAGKAWVTGLTWAIGSAFATNPGNTNSHNCIFTNCYAESGQPPSQIYAPALIVGGLLFENGHDKDATAPWLRAGAHSFTIPGIQAKRANGSSTTLTITAKNRAWNAVTPGTLTGSVNIPWSGVNDEGGAYSFGAVDGAEGSGTTTTAGMFCSVNNSSGSRLTIATSDSFQAGAKTALAIDPAGNVSIPRGQLTATIAPQVQAVVSAATVTPAFGNDLVKITAQAAALAIANPSGTAIAAFGLTIRIKDNGTARAITFGTQYRAVGVTLPTTTVASKTLYLGMIWNVDDTKFDIVSVAQEA